MFVVSIPAPSSIFLIDILRVSCLDCGVFLISAFIFLSWCLNFGSFDSYLPPADSSSPVSPRLPIMDFVFLLGLCLIVYGGDSLEIDVPAHCIHSMWAVGPHTI
jgi:hypothetical protein